MTHRLLAAGLVLALAAAAPALADPAPGQVEVRDDAGAPVGAAITGPDAVQAAVARVRTARTADARPWQVVAGSGTYGDAVVDEPNLTLRPATGAVVTITGTGGVNDTGGECLDVRRAAIVVEGLVCRAPTGRGVEVSPPANEGGVVLRNLVIDRAGGDGIGVLGGSGVVVEGVQVTSARADGIRLQNLTGPGPYRVTGTSVRLAGDDGIDLVDDVQRLEVSGTTIEASRDNGLESDDAGSSDLVVQGGAILRSGDHGVVLGGDGLRLAVTDTLLAENGDYGADLGSGSGFALRGVRLEASNKAGGVRFSTGLRAGGAYERLDLGGSTLDLPGEPRGVVVSAVSASRRAGLSPAPDGLVALGRDAAVKDTGGGTSAVTLRFPLSEAERASVRLAGLGIFEDDPPANGRAWQRLAGTVLDAAGNARVALGDRDIASGSDSRSAVYGVFAPPNGAPEILDVFPAPGATVNGRSVLVAAPVRDDTPLSTGSFALTVDGVRKGGVSFRDGVVRFRIGLLAPGDRRARLLVVDQSGLRTARDWVFRVANGRPAVVLARVRPRVGRPVGAGTVTFLVPVRDDDAVRRLGATVRVDGRQVPSRIRSGRVIARVTLKPGRHRVAVTVRDRDGAGGGRAWTVRAVRG